MENLLRAMQTIRRRSCFINGGFEPVAYSSKITAPVSPLIMISSPVDTFRITPRTAATAGN